jgi:hypothetical protein
MPGEFPAEIEQFIQQHIDSLAQLEALLLLHKDPSRWWDAGGLAKALYTSTDICTALLADLARRGFLKTETNPGPRYAFQVSDAELNRLVANLDALYQQRRVAVTTLIYSKPVSKVQTFADAFRLRREP